VNVGLLKALRAVVLAHAGEVPRRRHGKVLVSGRRAALPLRGSGVATCRGAAHRQQLPKRRGGGRARGSCSDDHWWRDRSASSVGRGVTPGVSWRRW
jgi:hypothetical protein